MDWTFLQNKTLLGFHPFVKKKHFVTTCGDKPFGHRTVAARGGQQTRDGEFTSSESSHSPPGELNKVPCGFSGLEAASLPDLGDKFEDLEENWSHGRGVPLRSYVQCEFR